MDEAKSITDQFKTYVAGVGTSIAAMAAPTALIAGLEHALSVAGEFAKMGKGIGASAGEMFDIQQQVGSGNMEGLTEGIKKIERELGAASAGSQEARSKFSNLGLNWQELSRSPVGDMAKKVADRIKEAGSAADQAHVRFELMGKGADGAAAGMAKLAGAPTGGGLTGGLIDSKDVQNVADLNTQWKAFKQNQLGSMGAMDALGVGIVGKMVGVARDAHVLKDMVTSGFDMDFVNEQAGLRDAMVHGNKAAQDAQDNAEAQNKLTTEVEQTVRAFERQAEMAGKTAEAIERTKAINALIRPDGTGPSPQERQDASNRIQDAQEAKAIAQANFDAIKSASELRNETDQINRGMALASGLGISLAEGLSRAAQQAKDLKAETDGVSQDAINWNRHEAERNADSKKVLEIAKQFGDPLENFGYRLEELQRFFDEGKISIEQFADAAADAFGKLPKLDDISDKLPQAVLQGSKEAASAQNKFEREQQDAERKQDVAGILRDMKKQKEETDKKKIELLEKIQANKALVRKGEV